VFFAFGYAFAIIFGAYRLQYGLSVGSLLAMIQLVQHIQSPFSGISLLIPKYYQVVASTERLMVIDDYKEEKIINHYDISQFKSIKISNLSFAYGEKEVIKDLSFELNQSELMHLKGDSGKGKTTCLKLILGLMKPQNGSISILNGNTEIRVTHETRSFFSYVPQENFILSGTIKENLNLYQTYDDDKLFEVLKICALYDEIKTLPDGLNTHLGERGKGLSEGQIQRLAIARALLKDAPVLLLDEITSALDQKTEEKILKQIKEMTDKAVILVSHRPLDQNIISKIVTLSS
jgi:ABC-type multidrug transport system fused ATPase/permease subunit